MRLRKLFAGVAAMATLLGGMALGANAAYAAEGTPNATFTFTVDDARQWTGRQVQYVKLADYQQYGNGAETTWGVKTVDDTTVSTAIGKALTAAGITPTPATADPMEYAMGLDNGGLDQSGTSPWNEGTTRKFADALSKNTTLKLADATLTDVEGSNGLKKQVSLPVGVYLFLDVKTNSTDDPDNPVVVVAQSAPIVVASGTINEDKKAITDPTTGVNVDFKNHLTPVTKTVDDKDNTVSTGQSVTYTLTTKLPITTGFDNYTFKLVDTPGVGQDVNASKSVLSVSMEGITLIEGSDFDVQETEREFAADGTKSFTIDFAKLLAKDGYNTNFAGKTVTVTYTAKVTADTDPVTNKVEVNDNNTTVEDHTNLTLGQFSFKKIDAKGNPLSGAEFKIEADDDNAEDDTVPVTPTTATATSSDKQGSEGVVTFKGLADGQYKVTETTAPNGFASFFAEFYVTIKNGKAVYFDGLDAWGLAEDSGNKDLTGGEITDYTVKNVRNITQLPLTGAAGTAMFTMIGVLLAGAGALVYVRSRRTRRMIAA